jgi:hypothetical protein
MGTRPTTTIASQALTLLNGELAGRASAALARRVLGDAPADPARQVERAFELALARRPAEQERAIAMGFLERQQRAFEALPAAPLCFEPLVPERLDKAYVAQLPGVAILSGPRQRWRYLRGRWGDVYNGTLSQDPDRGAAALFEPVSFGDVELSGRVRLRAGCRLAALLLRARPDQDVFVGLELRLDPQAGALELRRHAEEVELLARVDVPVRTDVWHDVRVVLEGARLRAWLDGEDAPRLDASVPASDLPGSFGARTAGEAVEIDDLTLTTGGRSHRLQADDGGSPQQRALESLCLALLNLNEFVYED